MESVKIPEPGMFTQCARATSLTPFGFFCTRRIPCISLPLRPYIRDGSNGAVKQRNEIKSASVSRASALPPRVAKKSRSSKKNAAFSESKRSIATFVSFPLKGGSSHFRGSLCEILTRQLFRSRPDFQRLLAPPQPASEESRKKTHTLRGSKNESSSSPSG